MIFFCTYFARVRVRLTHMANPGEPATDEVRVRLDNDAVLHVDRRLDNPVADVDPHVAGVRDGSVATGHEDQVARCYLCVRAHCSAFVDLIAGVVQQRHPSLSPGHHGETRAVKGRGAGTAPEVRLCGPGPGDGGRHR